MRRGVGGFGGRGEGEDAVGVEDGLRIWGKCVPAYSGKFCLPVDYSSAIFGFIICIFICFSFI
jgi:hypothetical protein